MFEVENEKKEPKNNWLEELASQSWNLELVVSGAAIFSTSFLPEIIENGTASYYENYQLSDSLLNFVLPTLAYGFAKAASYFLIFTFILHFIFRAFWIAMVGLRAVYPQGIVYENLPNLSSSVKDILSKKFGAVDDFIVRLDKICSQIFSIAFVLVLITFLMGIFYLLAFLFAIVLKTYLPEFYIIVKNILLVLYFIFMVFAFLVMYMSSSKKYSEMKFTTKSQLIMSNFSSVMFFGLYKPINYINYVFASNINKKKYYAYFAVGFLFFMIFSMSIYIKKTLEYNNIPFLETRNFYSAGSNDNLLKSWHYDNLRREGEEIIDASIQSDVIEEPFVKLFLNYNKMLDADLTKFCKEPSVPDSLERMKKRNIKDKARLACFGEYFQIALNDSILVAPEFLYQENGALKTKGLQLYVGTEYLPAGRNTFIIKKLEVDSLPKKVWVSHASIPFWFAKK